MIVVDTNVVAYLMIPGPHTPLVEAVGRRDPAWVAPPLIRHELFNVMVRQVRLAGAAAADVRTAFDLAMRRVRLTPQPSFAEVLDLAQRSGRSSYDCEFVAAAMALGVRLVTSDKQVLASFPGVAVSPEVFVA